MDADAIITMRQPGFDDNGDPCERVVNLERGMSEATFAAAKAFLSTGVWPQQEVSDAS